MFQKLWHGTYLAYFIGFISSLALTAFAFFLVVQKYSSPEILGALALVQALIQLRFFLHLGQEKKPYWETIVFLFMTLVLLIIVIGSLWIMNDLNARMMVMHD